MNLSAESQRELERLEELAQGAAYGSGDWKPFSDALSSLLTKLVELRRELASTRAEVDRLDGIRGELTQGQQSLMDQTVRIRRALGVAGDEGGDTFDHARRVLYERDEARRLAEQLRESWWERIPRPAPTRGVMPTGHSLADFKVANPLPWERVPGSPSTTGDAPREDAP